MRLFCPAIFFHTFFFSAATVLVLIGCQTHSKQTEPPSGDPWFASARLGNWPQFEQLQKSLNRPWDYAPSNVTALMIAARNGHVDFVSRLIQKKIVINRKDHHQYNALSYALNAPMPFETKLAMCRLLIQNGADPFAEDQFKLSGIALMIEFGMKSCLEDIKFSDFSPCDQVNRLSEITSLVSYAETEDELEIRDFLKTKGCK